MESLKEKIKEMGAAKFAGIVAAVVAVILIVAVTVVMVVREREPEVTEPETEEVMAVTEAETETEEVSAITYDEAGTYEDDAEYETGVITADGVELKGTTFETLTITEDVAEGTVNLEGVTVTKDLYVYGGGEHSVYVKEGSSIRNIEVTKANTHVVIEEGAAVESLNVLASNKVEINGTVENVTVTAPEEGTEVTWESGIALGENAEVKEINLYAATTVSAYKDVTVNVCADDVTFDGVTIVGAEETETTEETEDSKTETESTTSGSTTGDNSTSSESNSATATTDTTAGNTTADNGSTAATTDTTAQDTTTDTTPAQPAPTWDEFEDVMADLSSYIGPDAVSLIGYINEDTKAYVRGEYAKLKAQVEATCISGTTIDTGAASSVQSGYAQTISSELQSYADGIVAGLSGSAGVTVYPYHTTSGAVSTDGYSYNGCCKGYDASGNPVTIWISVTIGTNYPM